METFIIGDLKQTEILAKKFGKLLRGGEVVLLNGDLGAGKTTFTKLVLKSLGVKDNITSPTFTLMHEYKTKRFNIYHFDMYRLENGVEACSLGFDEYLNGDKKDSICFVEWSENIKDILHGQYISINISIEENGKRKFEISR